MSFGRRTIDNESRSSTRSGSDDAQFTRAARGGSVGGGGASNLIGVIALALVAGGLTFGVMYMLNGSARSVVANETGEPVDPKLSGTTAHSVVAKACLPMLRDLEEPLSESQRAMQLSVGIRRPDYYRCALTRDLGRFCAYTERMKIITELRVYFEGVRIRNKMSNEAMGSAAGLMTSKMAMAIGGDDGVSGAKPRHEADPYVVSLMQNLVKQGYISAGDFGWSIPALIKTALDGVKAERDPC